MDAGVPQAAVQTFFLVYGGEQQATGSVERLRFLNRSSRRSRRPEEGLSLYFQQGKKTRKRTLNIQHSTSNIERCDRTFLFNVGCSVLTVRCSLGSDSLRDRHYGNSNPPTIFRFVVFVSFHGRRSPIGGCLKFFLLRPTHRLTYSKEKFCRAPKRISP